jgi:WD40 repeat protein
MFSDPIVIQGHTSHVTSLTFSPDSKTLISAGMDNLVHVWSTLTWEKLGTLAGHSNSVNAINLSSDGRQILTASTDRTVRLWDVASTRVIRQYDFKGHSAVLAPDDRLIAALDNPWLTLADLQTGKILERFKPFPKRTTALAFSPDSATLVIGGQGDDLLIYQLPELALGHSIRQAHQAYTLSAKFSPTPGLLVTVGYEKTLKFWETDRWTQLDELLLPNQGLQSLAFSSAGDRLAIASDHRITVVNVEKRAVVHQEDLAPKGVYCLAFSPDGRWLASGAADKRLRIWALE